jgi:hypothetical protein
VTGGQIVGARRGRTEKEEGEDKERRRVKSWPSHG